MPKIKKNELRDLVKGFYEERTGTKIANKDVVPFIEDVTLAIEQALIDGYDVPLGNVGTLKVKDRKARKGVNPSLLKDLKEQGVPEEEAKLQAQVEIKATRALGFTPSKHMKETFKAEQE